MYVYFLHHARHARFKIGKANDVHKRFLALGGDREYSKEASYYIRLNTAERAHRIERVLHRLFESWNLPVCESGRFEGDTEQFDSACWPRVVQFLSDNSDLTDGSEITPLIGICPVVAEISPNGGQQKSAAGPTAAKQMKLVAAIARAKSEFDNAIQRIESGVQTLNHLQLRSCRILWNEDRRAKFVLVETQNQSDFEGADDVMSEEWAGVSIRYANGQFGVSNIVTTVSSWGKRFIRADLARMDDEMFDPYRDAIETTFAKLRLYG